MPREYGSEEEAAGAEAGVFLELFLFSLFLLKHRVLQVKKLKEKTKRLGGGSKNEVLFIPTARGCPSRHFPATPRTHRKWGRSPPAARIQGFSSLPRKIIRPHDEPLRGLRKGQDQHPTINADVVLYAGKLR